MRHCAYSFTSSDSTGDLGAGTIENADMSYWNCSSDFDMQQNAIMTKTKARETTLSKYTSVCTCMNSLEGF